MTISHFQMCRETVYSVFKMLSEIIIMLLVLWILSHRVASSKSRSNWQCLLLLDSKLQLLASNQPRNPIWWENCKSHGIRSPLLRLWEEGARPLLTPTKVQRNISIFMVLRCPIYRFSKYTIYVINTRLSICNWLLNKKTGWQRMYNFDLKWVKLRKLIKKKSFCQLNNEKE